MAAKPAQIAAVHRQVEQLRRYSDRLVGIGPFVVTLYFFFENISRLLPSNL